MISVGKINDIFDGEGITESHKSKSSVHGTDPTFKGTDHTKEMVPMLAYSKSMKESKKLNDQLCFAGIGATIAENFQIEMPEGTIGKSMLEFFV